MALRIPPVVVALLAALLMWLLRLAWPGLVLDIPGKRVIAAGLVLSGVVVAIMGVLAFGREGTTVDPMRPEKASALVVRGIYRYTRNPMYLGMLLILVALAVYVATPLAALPVAGFVWYMNRFQIRPEEEALEEAFGDSYRRYRSSVRRWL